MKFLVTPRWRIESEKWSWRVDRWADSKEKGKWKTTGWCPSLDSAFRHIEEQMLRGVDAKTKSEVVEAVEDIRRLIVEARARAEVDTPTGEPDADPEAL